MLPSKDQTDSLRLFLDMVWVGLQIGGGVVSGNPPSGAVSIIHFDDVTAMVVLCPAHWEGGEVNREQWIPPVLLYRASLASALTLTMSPCKSLVPPVHSRMGTGAQREQVCHGKNPLTNAAPFRGICRCCSSFHLTQLLETEQPHVLTASYLLLLQVDSLDFSLVGCLVPLDTR
uniref:Uncharacterized protein n=1 Tax=Rousettus aegyptiacus TaxID=9407 RepID=A0A7J8D6Y1_ROUAE|nr:hypothetical protein HJG63_008873 [Rousettus aegyptiacus]